MSENEVGDLIRQGESATVEFKRQIDPKPKKLAQEMAALANTDGGTILVGVADNGDVIGVTSPDELIQRIANIARDALQPPLRPMIQRTVFNALDLIRVDVPRQLLPRQVEGRHYIRVGTTVREASSEEVASLYTTRKGLSDLLRVLDAQFDGFRPRNLAPQTTTPTTPPSGDPWQRLEDLRIARYQGTQGLFLVHSWRPSEAPGQVADVAIRLCQHRQGPLSRGEVLNVQYHLGQRFFTEPVIINDPEDGFRLDVSAYAPFLCVAVVNFSNGSDPLTIERYVDFGG